jgi:glycosyltransferase involved in cell wall biosynthesis
MKISVITVCFNSAATIDDTLASVAAQRGVEVEHIVIDGGSSDDTMAIVERHRATVAYAVSEPDRGIYDAMNKGLAAASGDIVGYLNSDDCYAADDALAAVSNAFQSTGCDFAYGDIEMVDAAGRVARVWRTPNIGAGGISGTQIPHPAFFVRRSVLLAVAPAFDPSYRICADIKQQLIVVNKLRACGNQLSRPIVRMRLGGRSTSTLANYLQSWRESRRAWNEVMGRGGALYTLRKVLWKLGGVRMLRSRVIAK